MADIKTNFQSGNPFPDSGNPVNDALRQLNQMIIYDPSVVNLTSGGASNALEAAKNLVGSKRPYIFRFLINPVSMQQSIKKIMRPVLEKKGWEIVHFPGTPNEMIPMKFSGTTGSIVPPPLLWQAGIRDTKMSVNYQRFVQLKNLILAANNDLKMFYDGMLYEGAVSDFTFDENANEPFSIKFSFTFNAYPDRTKNRGSFDLTQLPIARNILQAGVPI